MDEPTFNDDIWHADDCGGPPFCDGCGWIDANQLWWPGPCPDEHREFSWRAPSRAPMHDARAPTFATLANRIADGSGLCQIGR